MIAVRKSRYILDTKWPDGLRTRFRMPSEGKAKELDLRVQLAILDNTWDNLRTTLQMAPEKKVVSAGLFRDIAEEYYQQWVLPRNKSAASKRTFLERFNERFGHLPLRAIRLRHADSYVAWRQESEVANASINRELSCLRHFFEWAVDREFIDRNPLARIKRMQEQEWAGPRPTDEVVEAVFGKLDPRFLPVFVLIRETGARRGEVLGLQHWQIDRERRVVTFAKRTKNGKNTIAPLTDRALQAIDSVPVLPGCPYVFYNPETGTRWCDARKPWLAARKAAGYPWLRVRDLRPAFGIEASEDGVPMHFIQSVFGHGSVAVTERYYAKFRPNGAASAVRQAIEAARKSKTLAQGLAQEEKIEGGA